MHDSLDVTHDLSKDYHAEYAIQCRCDVPAGGAGIFWAKVRHRHGKGAKNARNQSNHTNAAGFNYLDKVHCNVGQ